MTTVPIIPIHDFPTYILHPLHQIHKATHFKFAFGIDHIVILLIVSPSYRHLHHTNILEELMLMRRSHRFYRQYNRLTQLLKQVFQQPFLYLTILSLREVFQQKKLASNSSHLSFPLRCSDAAYPI